ncbi:MAG: HIT domain-containing protein [Candidatus Heimdallarchaeota archaeon]
MVRCIFCKIAEGEVKSWTVYEDEVVKAFFDINPASEGHTLIIPKKHYENIYEIPENVLERIIIIAKKLAIIYKKALDVKAVNILHASGKEAQQDVFHFHIHLVPRYENDKLNLWYQTRPEVKANFDKILEKTKKFID